MAFYRRDGDATSRLQLTPRAPRAMLLLAMDNALSPISEFQVVVRGHREPLWVVLYPDDIVLVYHGDVVRGLAAGVPRPMRCLFGGLWRRRADGAGRLSADKCLIRGIGEIDSATFAALDAALRKSERGRECAT